MPNKVGNKRVGLEPGNANSHWLCHLQERWARPVSGQSLALFRMVFGLIMALEALSLFLPSESTAGKVMLEVYYTGQNLGMPFPYPGFSWLPWLPSWGFKALVCLMGLAGLALAFGYRYRLAAVTLFLTWGYLYAVESTRTYWMSYYYLELLIAFLMMGLPAQRCWSLDSRHSATSGASDVPYWSIGILRFQLVVMYAYAGWAKLNADWLLDAQPVTYFLSFPHVMERLQGWLPFMPADRLQAWLASPVLAYGIAWGGALFDILAGPLLLFRRTRYLGLGLMGLFHGLNHTLLFNDLLWFPALGLGSALIFLEPTWPTRLLRCLRQPNWTPPERSWALIGMLAIPPLGGLLGWKADRDKESTSSARLSNILFMGILAWCMFQIGFPLRQYLIPGDARITFEGLSWSWRLKAEVYRASPCEIQLVDDRILKKEPDQSMRVDGLAWPGPKDFYRCLDPSFNDWDKLPEILILREPLIGERILYNPSGAEVPIARSPAAISARLKTLWNELYGRSPSSAHPLMPLSRILGDYKEALEKKGHGVRDTQHAMQLLRQMHGPEGDGSMMPFLRRMQPFALTGAQPPEVPLYVVEDKSLAIRQSNHAQQIDRKAWQHGSYTQIAGEPDYVAGTDTQWLTVHIPTPGPEFRGQMPQASLMQGWTEGQWGDPFIDWDYARDLSMSKAMHISTSPFHLRTYARSIADRWENSRGHRPVVRAQTHVSFNFRPSQTHIEPMADLASVPRFYLSHHDWIRSTTPDRIPEEARRTRRP